MHCSVVSGMTLRLLVINILPLSPAINKLWRLLPAIGVTTGRTMVWRRCIENTWPVSAFAAGSEARYRLRIAISAYPTCIRRPVREGVVPVGILLCRLAWKNGVATRWWKNFDDMFVYSFWQNSRTWRTHTQTHTHRRTDNAWRHRPRLHIASRGKNVLLPSIK